MAASPTASNAATAAAAARDVMRPLHDSSGADCSSAPPSAAAAAAATSLADGERPRLRGGGRTGGDGGRVGRGAPPLQKKKRFSGGSGMRIRGERVGRAIMHRAWQAGHRHPLAGRITSGVSKAARSAYRQIQYSRGNAAGWGVCRHARSRRQTYRAGRWYRRATRAAVATCHALKRRQRSACARPKVPPRAQHFHSGVDATAYSRARAAVAVGGRGISVRVGLGRSRATTCHHAAR